MNRRHLTDTDALDWQTRSTSMYQVSLGAKINQKVQLHPNSVHRLTLMLFRLSSLREGLSLRICLRLSSTSVMLGASSATGLHGSYLAAPEIQNSALIDRHKP